MSQNLTFYIYDYETFGQHPGLDRPAQFAGIRTDLEFHPVEDPLVLYCSPAQDYLPDPEAVMITGITPQKALSEGVNEARFAHQIHRVLSQPNTCILGYNNIRFDDEFSRHIFYRNFYDPYAYSWKNGNSRWDLLDLTRACYALRPEGIIWPKNEQGLPSFKLEHLTKANSIKHTQAHDALSDVYATMALAKLLKSAQPRLFHYFYAHRSKHKINTLIHIGDMAPLVHVSGMFSPEKGHTSWILPIAWHPDNQNAVIVCDLAGDITPLLSLKADVLRERLYTPRDQLGSECAQVPLKLVHINKCPILAPAKTLSRENAQRLGIDQQHCLKNLELLRRYPDIREKMVAIFDGQKPFPKVNNVDAQLYDGFFNDFDRAAISTIQKTLPENLPNLKIVFQDPRLETLFFRFRARNYPETLSEKDQQRWKAHFNTVLSPGIIKEYLLKLKEMLLEYEDNPEKQTLIHLLIQYANQKKRYGEHVVSQTGIEPVTSP
ncbi:exodeoxyribonuclease I [Candidatus Williamhamiltonella defendens]|uniref:exodeoxyribonuclease I n=1 Tax=Candidatus Williamhamiltonella defendens TaxID=138072 RepID=UPI000C1F5391|nr:exodeoxyribonuclease I [Candidatus Hamiltonella defensa]